MEPCKRRMGSVLTKCLTGCVLPAGQARPCLWAKVCALIRVGGLLQELPCCWTEHPVPPGPMLGMQHALYHSSLLPGRGFFSLTDQLVTRRGPSLKLANQNLVGLNSCCFLVKGKWIFLSSTYLRYLFKEGTPRSQASANSHEFWRVANFNLNLFCSEGVSVVLRF